jgi:holo-[acyl-carrier protein] synthase
LIVGIGVDLVEVVRMERALARGERIQRRLFTPGEIAYCTRHTRPAVHFAARFAAKEAGLKALGTGLRLGVSWRELEVRRERGGPPVLVLSGRTRELARARGAERMLLALSHDGDYAIAQAMLVDERP